MDLQCDRMKRDTFPKLMIKCRKFEITNQDDQQSNGSRNGVDDL